MRRALAIGIALVFLLLPQAASSTALGPAFPPGLWCGVGKVPVGKQITIKGRRLTFVSGKMTFGLTSKNGDAAGAVDADLRFHYEDKSSKEDFEGEFRYVGDFDINGPARQPKLQGTWKVKVSSSPPSTARRSRFRSTPPRRRSPGSTSTSHPSTSSSATGPAPRAGSGRRPASSRPRRALSADSALVNGRPRVFVTRRVPESVREELERSFALDVHDEELPPPRDELLSRAAGCDGPRDDADRPRRRGAAGCGRPAAARRRQLRRRPRQRRPRGVRAPRDHGRQHARRAHRRDGGDDGRAHAGAHAACRRGRPFPAPRRVAVGADVHARPRPRAA